MQKKPFSGRSLPQTHVVNWGACRETSSPLWRSPPFRLPASVSLSDAAAPWLQFKHCLQVLLHHPDEKPLMLQRGFKVSPGFLTQVAVTTQYVSISVCYFTFSSTLQLEEWNHLRSPWLWSHKACLSDGSVAYIFISNSIGQNFTL